MGFEGQKINNDQQSSQETEPKNKFLEARDVYRERASELERNVAEVQAAKHETALYRIMQRTQDDPELINALNGFLDALDHRSRYGDETQPLGGEQREKLTQFFQEKSKELHFLTGNRPAQEI